MTDAGTNAFVLGRRELAVIDPGPALPAQTDALLAAIDGRPVRAILVTHAHLDHSPGARPLARATDAPVLAFGTAEAGRRPAMAALAGIGGGEGVDRDFAPDRVLSDGEVIAADDWTLRALHTPGHMGNHLTLHWLEGRAAFTGDVVMGWASTLISPPDGDLGQFFDSLDRIEALGVETLLPAHGPPVIDPVARCRALRDHRRARQAAILAALDQPRAIPDLVTMLYADTPLALHPAAARNVLAHLIHLSEAGQVAAMPRIGPDAIWHRH
jgi:glyoxylase-like metal-dependent hydrolase (beta-lactamase superfamily II)